MRLVAIVMLITLVGCAHLETKPAPVIEVRIPVPVPCIDAAPDRPQYRFGVGDMPSEKEAAMLLARDFEAAKNYGVAWETAASGCFTPPAR